MSQWSRNAVWPTLIRNGMIRQPGSEGWQGAVSPQGGVTMRNANSQRVDGQIDPQGTITAKYSGPACITNVRLA